MELKAKHYVLAACFGIAVGAAGTAKKAFEATLQDFDECRTELRDNLIDDMDLQSKGHWKTVWPFGEQYVVLVTQEEADKLSDMICVIPQIFDPEDIQAVEAVPILTDGIYRLKPSPR